jgi:alanine racemase
VTAYRPVRAEIDLDAVRANVQALRTRCSPAALLAVVKADGYGHGAVPVARAALEAGASALGVALVEEGIELRDAGIDAPVLVLSEPVPEAAGSVVSHRLTPVVYTLAGIDTLAKAVADRSGSASACTSRSTPACTASAAPPGMRWASPPRSSTGPSSSLRGCAPTSRSPTSRESTRSAPRFEAVLAGLQARDIPTGTVHAANTTGAIAWPDARYDLVASARLLRDRRRRLDGCVELGRRCR